MSKKDSNREVAKRLLAAMGVAGAGAGAVAVGAPAIPVAIATALVAKVLDTLFEGRPETPDPAKIAEQIHIQAGADYATVLKDALISAAGLSPPEYKTELDRLAAVVEGRDRIAKEELLLKAVQKLYQEIRDPTDQPEEFGKRIQRLESISLAKLPSTSPLLYGRRKELRILDAAWKDPKTKMVAAVAWGGVGKTALVNSWLSRIGEDGYGGAERVLGWSFYSQGAAEGRQASADLFIATALAWFGDPDPTAGSPWDKGQRLAQLIRQHRTLLVLDGLEPLQQPTSHPGQIKDPALRCLLRELARDNPGLCVVTTRLAVADLREFTAPAVRRIQLERLSASAGVALLKKLGVKGAKADLRAAVDEVRGHALALNLLGNYLRVVLGGDVRRRDQIPKLTDDRGQGAHARHVMGWYERWFQGKPELDVLRLLGLFDRPAGPGAIQALRADPPIGGLTDRLGGLSQADWHFALDALRQAGLLARQDPASPGTLDAHPLIREHFGEKLQAENPDGWKEAHSRLYEHYKRQAPHLPDTIEQMTPLFAAVAHGCQAERFQEALHEVYRARIQRGDEFFNARKLGAFGADLAALSGFFVTPWTQPVAQLREASRSFLLNEAGYRLRALGRLAEAAEPMQAGLQADLRLQDWKNAAIQAATLSELHLTMGDLGRAEQRARQSVDLADKSGGAFDRMAVRTALADALHQAGRIRQALDLFEQAEKMQKERQPQFPLLYSVQGFQYCDLLLGEGRYEEVHTRAKKFFEWRHPSDPLLDIALEYLSLGRACLLQGEAGQADALAPAADHLNQAVDGLRQSGNQDDIPRGLLARASLYRLKGDFPLARRDLDEAAEIAARGQMSLHQADCHLESARLHLAAGESEHTRRSLDQGATMIDDMGYHRRDPEVRLAQAGLLLAEGDKPAARKALAAARKMIDDMGLHRWDFEAEQLDKAIG